jgi:hypothetical protein
MSWPNKGGRSASCRTSSQDLDGITQLVGTWFQDHIAPRLAGPETVVRGHVVVNMTRSRTATT